MKQTAVNDAIRNVAIIAHVDHGKTTLVDAIFKQSGVYRDNQETTDRAMDKMELERERGITIAAKNCAVEWKGTKINIIDTPGHADFGGEVERSLSMVDGAILLVDSSEGPLPQTRFVLSKALKSGLALIVVVNKIDRKDARALEVLDEVYDLLIDLDANEDQLNFPVLYAIGKDGIAQKELDAQGTDLVPLFETILEEVPGPSFDAEAPFQMLVSDLSYSDYLGRLAIGKVVNGSVNAKDNLVCIDHEDNFKNLKISKLAMYSGMDLQDAAGAEPGDIIVLAGIDDVTIGDTICSKANPRALKRITVDEPTVFMRFMKNSSPLAGKDGKMVQPSRIKERLEKESLRNVAIEVEPSEDKESFIVKGRGEFQMAILIETMRREGFELCVGRPEVIYKTIDGKKHEPMEYLSIDVDDCFTGIVTEKLSMRKGIMTNLSNHGTGRVRIDFTIPSRALIGFREEFLSDTKGTGIMNSYFAGYEPFRGEFSLKRGGALVADRPGKALAYSLFNLEPRGCLIITPGVEVYEGMIIGEHNRDNDLDVNPTKGKKLSNMRASGKDESVVLTPVVPLTLENALSLIKEDELLEVTPNSIRLRKAVLAATERKIIRKRGES